jgi:hypothetical protein
MDRRQTVRRWLELRDREGLTYAQLSARCGIPVNTLTHWAWRLRKEGAAAVEQPEFVELVPKPRTAASASPHLVVELRNDLRVHVDADFDPDVLVRVVRALERC